MMKLVIQEIYSRKFVVTLIRENVPELQRAKNTPLCKLQECVSESESINFQKCEQ